MSRDSYMKRILGEEKYQELRSSKVLIVGAGGIGCEMLKNLVLMGYGEIHIVDLDTIDLSNLNRQFLFRMKDIKKPKCTTAVEAVKHFSNSKLVAHQGNIMDTTQFPITWFAEFKIIFNALDNMAARRYVNKICQFLDNVPLLESGTEGFFGYMQPIFPGKTQCYDCTTKETPKAIPVCTIRSTPSLPVHCVVWAKSFLFQQLFSDEEEVLDPSTLGTDDPAEIKRIVSESNELNSLKKKMTDDDFALAVIDKMFKTDIERLLLMDALWKTRTKPEPLDISKFKLDCPPADVSGARCWTLNETLSQFVVATKVLQKRMVSEESIVFDKDDEDTLDFVACAANIRAHIFHIVQKSKFDIKQIAGNIIPAVATTNAVVSGLVALSSLKMIQGIPIMSHVNVFTTQGSRLSNGRYVSAPNVEPANPECAVCSNVIRGVLHISSEMKLGALVEALQEKYGYGDYSLVDTAPTHRLLADYDFDDMLENTIAECGIKDGSIISFADEEGEDEVMKSCEFYIVLDSKLKLPELGTIPTRKRKLEESQDEEHDSKRRVIDIDEPDLIEL